VRGLRVRVQVGARASRGGGRRPRCRFARGARRSDGAVEREGNRLTLRKGSDPFRSVSSQCQQPTPVAPHPKRAARH
jgi:hypothetical protein